MKYIEKFFHVERSSSTLCVFCSPRHAITSFTKYQIFFKSGILKLVISLSEKPIATALYDWEDWGNNWHIILEYDLPPTISGLYWLYNVASTMCLHYCPENGWNALLYSTTTKTTLYSSLFIISIICVFVILCFLSLFSFFL